MVPSKWNYGLARRGHAHGRRGHRKSAVAVGQTFTQSMSVTAVSTATLSKLLNPATGIPVIFWGVRHDRINPNGDSDLERVLDTHGITQFQASANQNPQRVKDWCNAAAVGGLVAGPSAYSFRIVNSIGSYGSSIPGQFDLQRFKDDVDAFWAAAVVLGIDADLRTLAANGTWWGIMLGDDIGNANTKPTAAQWDAMATHVKIEVPEVVTWCRTRPGQIATGTYDVLDMIQAQIGTIGEGATQQSVIDWTDVQLTGISDRNIPAVQFGINVEKGNGSGIISSRGYTKTNGMSMITPEELDRTWGYWVGLDVVGGLSSWEYDSHDEIPIIPADDPNYPAQDCSPNRTYADWWDDIASCSPGGMVAEVATQVAAAAAHIAVPLTR